MSHFGPQIYRMIHAFLLYVGRSNEVFTLQTHYSMLGYIHVHVYTCSRATVVCGAQTDISFSVVEGLLLCGRGTLAGGQCFIWRTVQFRCFDG